MESLDIRFTYLLRSTHQNAKGELSVVLRVNYRCERRDIFTGL